jgi:hypothetical protein
MTALVSGASPDISEIIQGGNPPHLQFHNFGGFAQDTWQATRRLTLTYGVRWDFNPPPTEASGNTFAFSETSNLATATLLPKGSPLWHGDWKNFAPRVGASYLFRANSSRPTVLRAGFGQFYDIGTSTAGALDTGGGWFPYSLATIYCNRGAGTGCNNPFPYNGPEPPFTFTQPYVQMWTFDPHLKLPYSLEWNVALEQTITPNETFKVTYLGSAGRRLLWDSVYSNPNPIVTSLYLTTNAGYSNYDSLQLQFQRRLAHGLQALVSYAWSHSLDTNSADVRYTGSPSSNPGQDYGNSDFDIRHNASMAVTYDIHLPRVSNSWVRGVVENWSIDGIASARSGLPLTVTYTPAAPGPYNASGTAFAFRPDQVSGVPVYISDPNAPGGKRLNLAAFTIPSTLEQGSEGRNSITGFPLVEIDLALRRQFNLGEHVKLQFRAEGFNVINHPNFGNLLNTIGTCSQGIACTPVYGWGTSQAMLNQSLGSGGFYGSGFGSLYQVGGPRSFQLSLKLQF